METPRQGTLTGGPLGATMGTPTKIKVRLQRPQSASVKRPNERQQREMNLRTSVKDKRLDMAPPEDTTFGASPSSDVPLIETDLQGSGRRLSWNYAAIKCYAYGEGEINFLVKNKSETKRLMVNGEDVKPGKSVSLNSDSSFTNKIVFGPTDADPVVFTCVITRGDPGAKMYQLILEKDVVSSPLPFPIEET